MLKSSHPHVFCKKDVLENFAKFTEKHLCQSLFINKVAGLCQSLFINKVAGLRPATLLKKRLWHRCFPVNFAKFLRTPFLQNTSWRLLLYAERSSHSDSIPEKEMFLIFIVIEIVRELKYNNGLPPEVSSKSELLHRYFSFLFSAGTSIIKNRGCF